MGGILRGPIMLNRLTVSALLKAVILTTAFCVVLGLSLNAWDSWGRLQVTSRISVIADASANLFKAMHNLRTDRSTTNRLLIPISPSTATSTNTCGIFAIPKCPRWAQRSGNLRQSNSTSKKRWCLSWIACSRC
jgi:hypothetical protein